MTITAIDSVIHHVADLGPTLEGYGRLGLTLTRVGDEARLTVGAFSLRFRVGSGKPTLVVRATDGVNADDGAGMTVVTGRTETEAPSHAFPLRRLDHLAAIAHDLDAKRDYWRDALGVPVTGEVPTPTMLILQLAIGDAVLELLGPTFPDSPIYRREPGLISMASWEVDDVDAAASLAKSRGFTVTDPAAGVLPGTRIATIAGEQLGGVNMQLLQRVG